MKTLKDLAAQYTWQPIGTAPIDEVTVIVNAPQLESGCTMAYLKDGKWHSIFNGEPFGVHVKAPTRWMPLPSQDNPIPQIIEVMEKMAQTLESAERYMKASDPNVMTTKKITAALAAYKKLCEEVE